MSVSTFKCKNCGKYFEEKYCNHCGEKRYHEKDKNIINFFEDGLHFITHFDGTLFTTLKTMALKPGKLSLDYCNGIRKRYFKPLSFFLLLVILYLLFPYFNGLNMEMQIYTTNAIYGKFANSEIHKAMVRTGMDMDQLSLIFHHKSGTLSKFLLIIIIPFSALFLKLILFRRKKYFFDYLIYATEMNCIYLLWGFLIFPFLVYLISLIGFPYTIHDEFIGSIIYIFLSIYVAISLRRFFHLKWFPSIIVTLLFLFAHVIIVMFIYKFILFYLTIIQL